MSAAILASFSFLSAFLLNFYGFRILKLYGAYMFFPQTLVMYIGLTALTKELFGEYYDMSLHMNYKLLGIIAYFLLSAVLRRFPV